jgi:hypothetical protein
MRHRLLGLVAVATVATLVACTDSIPTGTGAPGANLRVRTTEVVPTGTLDQEIIAIIGFWPKGQETDLLKKWEQIKKKYEEGQTDPKKLQEAIKKLFETSKHILKETKHMDDPPTGESPEAAAARLILYMNLYIFGGPDTDPPPYDPDADNAVGFLRPNAPLTIVTPSGDAGVHFDAGSVDEDRIIIVTQNPTQYADCDGPLLTELCQYPLFYDIASYPEGPLLKVAQAEICHPEEGEPGGPPDEATHLRLRLAHPAPSDAADYVPGGSVRITPVGVEDIEILPLISQTFLPSCEDVSYTPLPPEEIGASLFERGVRLASALASRVGKFLAPRSAYAIDQGGGGEFLDFGSPFNNVDPGNSFTVDFETPSLGITQNQIVNPYSTSDVSFTPIGANSQIGLVHNWGTSACVPPNSPNQKLGTGTTAGGNSSIGFSNFSIRATFSTPVATSQTVLVDVQALSGETARVRLFDASDVQVGSGTSVVPVVGVCTGYTGGNRGATTVYASPSQPATYAIIDLVPVSSSVFVIDNFKLQ